MKRNTSRRDNDAHDHVQDADVLLLSGRISRQDGDVSKKMRGETLYISLLHVFLHSSQRCESICCLSVCLFMSPRHTIPRKARHTLGQMHKVGRNLDIKFACAGAYVKRDNMQPDGLITAVIFHLTQRVARPRTSTQNVLCMYIANGTNTLNKHVTKCQ